MLEQEEGSGVSSRNVFMKIEGCNPNLNSALPSHLELFDSLAKIQSQIEQGEYISTGVHDIAIAWTSRWPVGTGTGEYMTPNRP